MKNRYLYLDIIRCLACFMVVVMHSLRGGGAKTIVALDTFAKPCNALFFMTSGALLLPVVGGGGNFLKKRLSKIVVPCFLWTIIYNVEHVAFDDYSLIDAIDKLIYIPFCSNAYGILWFVYVLIGLYFLAPIITPWLISSQRKNVEFVLLLWLISLIFLIMRNYIEIPDDEQSMLYYFSGYAGYFLLGYYLHRYRPGINSILLVAFIVLPFLIALLIRMPFFSDIDRWSVLGYLSLFTALCSLWYFEIVEKITARLIHDDSKKSLVSCISPIISIISNLSFGVYLMHIPVRNALWHIPFVQAYGWKVELTLTILLTFLLSLLVAYIISKFSFAKYIIGYTSKSK